MFRPYSGPCMLVARVRGRDDTGKIGTTQVNNRYDSATQSAIALPSELFREIGFELGLFWLKLGLFLAKLALNWVCFFAKSPFLGEK